MKDTKWEKKKKAKKHTNWFVQEKENVFKYPMPIPPSEYNNLLSINLFHYYILLDFFSFLWFIFMFPFHKWQWKINQNNNRRRITQPATKSSFHWKNMPKYRESNIQTTNNNNNKTLNKKNADDMHESKCGTKSQTKKKWNWIKEIKKEKWKKQSRSNSHKP